MNHTNLLKIPLHHKTTYMSVRWSSTLPDSLHTDRQTDRQTDRETARGRLSDGQTEAEQQRPRVSGLNNLNATESFIFSRKTSSGPDATRLWVTATITQEPGIEKG